ncbi:unnamed protein product [Microthlaspi erraticum]|uniref:FAS1 domain-containing protein n=1 Tax=Microthlaspi erraticum TaxID=1685480 RepID=A0A6D2HQC6_9BRAS|nr:unnamed protein product [Microthlaspi erraticum]
MSSSSSSLILFFFFFLFASTFLFTSSNSFNITEILEQNKDFSTFNKLLSQTQLASTINSRQTVTVLALSNDVMSSSSPDRSTDEIKNILSLHIVVDYYDIKKLKDLKDKTVILTTLLQSSGQAKGRQGFVNATVMKNGDVEFGSAVPGSILSAKLIDSVASQPPSISVLHISSELPIMIDLPNDSPYKSSSPLPAQPPGDDDYTYDEPPSPPSSAPAASATASHGKSNSTNGVAAISSQFDVAFAVVMSSFCLFMKVW